MKACYLILLVLIFMLLSCSKKGDLEVNPTYIKGDTLVYISFNRSFLDESKSNTRVDVKGEPGYVTGIDGKPENAGFFDHNVNIQFQFAPQDSMKISFWFAPFRLNKGASILDCLDNLFSVYVSEVNTEYVDAYSAATYTLSVGNRNGTDLDIDLQAKPYPADTAFFDKHTEWHQLQLFIGENSCPRLVLNSQPVGEIHPDINPFANRRRLLMTIGSGGTGGYSFCGKIDEFFIQKL